jgi:hypothetical protein
MALGVGQERGAALSFTPALALQKRVVRDKMDHSDIEDIEEKLGEIEYNLPSAQTQLLIIIAKLLIELVRRSQK